MKHDVTNKKISIIIPLYNEIKHLEDLIVRLSDTLSEISDNYELLFIDDHSTDGSFEYLEKFKRGNKIRVYRKKGQRGKSYSLLEGFQKATGDIIGMIDADLQYPPEALLHMINKLEKSDIVVANRKKYQEHFVRKITSKGFRYLFGGMLFGLRHDIQAGLKVFTKEVIHTISFHPSSSWTFDLEFLYRAHKAGFHIVNHDIVFTKRTNGSSNVSLFKTIFEIGSHALNLRTKKIHPAFIAPHSKTSMKGAGIGHNRQKFITHTTLPHKKSALETFTPIQKTLAFLIVGIMIIGLFAKTLLTLQIIVGLLSFIYFVDVLFNLILVTKSIHHDLEVSIEEKDLQKIDETTLPVYSILCPLYKEGHVVPAFLDAIEKIEYPKEKLDVLLLLEEDDKETQEACKSITLPSYVTTLVVPHSIPKTKPKACNYGLSFAKGEYIVIYDAEDIPDPKQLKIAYNAFQKAPKEVVCLQAKLNYFNPHQNLLTRFFTAEYSLWFDMTLPGLQSLNTSIPLGGTSNHFKTKVLKNLFGWDAFNVTEDADLGARLFKHGYQTAIIDSVTLEEANSNVFNWIRQRSRWLKGYMQTYLVHNRDFFSFVKTSKHHALIFQLIIGGKIAFILINPILWLATFSYFALYQQVGETIDLLYPSVVFYMAVTSLIFGNFLFMYYYMLGCVKRGHFTLIKYVFFIPFYWILISIAGFIAFYQLLFKPHYWEKTIHGLSKQNASKKIATQISLTPANLYPVEKSAQTKRSFAIPFQNSLGPLFLVAGTLISHVINFVFNAYLGRVLSFSDFGVLSLLGGFMYISSIIFGSLTQTINYKTGFLEGKYGGFASLGFWKTIRSKMILFTLITTIIWIVLTPMLATYFQMDTILPLIAFSPIWMVGFLAAVDKGYLSGRLFFLGLGILLIGEAAIKLILALILSYSNLSSYMYITLPISYIGAFLIGILFILFYHKNTKKPEITTGYEFPKKYFAASVVSLLSTITFLTIDIILAKHYLSPEAAGQYSLIALPGKMIFFLGTLATQFIIPFVSRKEGQAKDSTQTLYRILFATYLLSLGGFLSFGVFSPITVPLLYGEKTVHIIQYLIPFTYGMMCFTISRVFVSYYLTKKMYLFPIVTFLLGIFQIGLMHLYHDSVSDIVNTMLLIGVANLIVTVIMHAFSHVVAVIESNIKDFIELFIAQTNKKPHKGKLKILIYNWRDIRHVWAGGAEVYIHEIAREWAKEGHSVTIFSGNDGHDPRNETIDGVSIFRRGGLYTVYIWGLLYYLFKFRKHYDIIVDSENGIPFFTPLYSRIPVVLLIHHIHQDIFKKHLRFPLSAIGQFLEAVAMPFVYKKATVVTVSNSSKKEILNLNLFESNQIEIVNPGIHPAQFIKSKKTTYPLFTYLGRMKPYKNIDIAIKAFAKIVHTHPTARLALIGDGESIPMLKELIFTLGIEKSVDLLGKVNESIKTEVLSKSWVVLQPSTIEGWGITVIEANASATPVIASNVQGLKDSIVNGTTGILVELNNIDAFAKEMNAFITDTKYRDILSQNAYQWSQSFSWEKTGQRFLRIILETKEKSYQMPTMNKFSLAQS